jgi:hypothetical protein
MAQSTLAGIAKAVLPKAQAKKKSRPGSGIEARLSIRILVWVRRVSQAGFLALFLYFLFQTAFRGSFASADTAVRLPLPVEAFLLADPFVAPGICAATSASSRTRPRRASRRSTTCSTLSSRRASPAARSAASSIRSASRSARSASA